MAYGIVGLVGWLGLVLYWPIRATRQFWSRHRAAASLFVLTLMLVFGVSFFQPLMLNEQILVTLYFLIGVFAAIARRDDGADDDTDSVAGHRSSDSASIAQRDQAHLSGKNGVWYEAVEPKPGVTVVCAEPTAYALKPA